VIEDRRGAPECANQGRPAAPIARIAVDKDGPDSRHRRTRSFTNRAAYIRTHGVNVPNRPVHAHRLLRGAGPSAMRGAAPQKTPCATYGRRGVLRARSCGSRLMAAVGDTLGLDRIECGGAIAHSGEMPYVQKPLQRAGHRGAGHRMADYAL